MILSDQQGWGTPKNLGQLIDIMHHQTCTKPATSTNTTDEASLDSRQKLFFSFCSTIYSYMYNKPNPAQMSFYTKLSRKMLMFCLFVVVLRSWIKVQA